jgi:two-component system cell cycle sensor histidine kinase/response regulator CckA
VTITTGNVEYAYGLPDGLWAVTANEQAMPRAIQNLLNNAAEAMPNGGLIRIEAGNEVVLRGQIPQLQPGLYVRISIADGGCGIPEEDLPRIFDPYFSTKERGKQCGMGLGLAVCQAIVCEHRGAITVDSRVRAGTTVHLFLAAAGEPARPSQPQKQRDAQPRAGTGRILVMDDQEMVRTAACDMLTRLGYTPVATCDGAEAVRVYRQALESGERFSAVILDLTTPGGVSGTGTITDLLEIDPKVVALISSGYVNDPALGDFAAHGFRGVLPKPYDLAELSHALHAALHGQ